MSPNVNKLIKQLCKCIVPSSVASSEHEEQALYNRLRNKCFFILLDMDDKSTPEIPEESLEQQIQFKLTCAIYHLHCQQRGNDAQRLMQLVDLWKSSKFMLNNPFSVNDSRTFQITEQDALLSILLNLADLDRNMSSNSLQFFPNLSEPMIQRNEKYVPSFLNTFASKNQFISSIIPSNIEPKECSFIESKPKAISSSLNSFSMLDILPPKYEKQQSIYFTECDPNKLHLYRQRQSHSRGHT
jgi:hypothetical protein